MIKTRISTNEADHACYETMLIYNIYTDGHGKSILTDHITIFCLALLFCCRMNTNGSVASNHIHSFAAGVLGGEVDNVVAHDV